jgi:hypothetical protein
MRCFRRLVESSLLYVCVLPPLSSLMFSYPIQHGHLREMLLQTARELGAETRTNAEVVEVAEDCRSVRLASGEVIKADVIIGADGSRGMCRALVAPQDPPNATGVMLFKYVLWLQPPFFPCYVFTGIISAVIPADRIRADPELRSLVEQEQVIINYYFVRPISCWLTEGITVGMVWARTSIGVLPHRMS